MPIMDEVPIKNTAVQILDGAILLREQAVALGFPPGTRDPEMLPSAVGYDRAQRSLAKRLTVCLVHPRAASLLGALKLDPAALEARLSQQVALGEVYNGLTQIHQAAVNGRRLVDGGKVLARAVVRAEVEQRLAQLKGTPEGQKLADDFAEIRDTEGQRASDRADAREESRALAAEAQRHLANVQNRRQLLNTVKEMQEGGSPSWREMVAAGKTLRDLQAEADARNTPR